MSHPALKILIVGGGSAGRRHFRYLHEHGQHCAVCDPNDACRVLAEFPEAEHLREYGEADLARFDAVVICTPPFLHVPQMIAAARAGCHVLTEKPLTVLHNEGLDELRAIVAEKQVVAAVSFPYANMRAMDRIIELVRAGELGRVRSVHIHHGQNILKPRPDYFQTYYARDDQGGGALQDDVMHVLMGLEMLFGPEQEVTCQRHNVGIRRQDVTSDDTVFLWLRYAEDVVVAVDFTMQCDLVHYEWIVNGEKRVIRFEVLENRLEIFDGASGRTAVETFDDGWDETFRSNDHNFVAAIRGTEQVRCTLDMAITNHRAVLAARQSAQEGRAVVV